MVLFVINVTVGLTGTGRFIDMYSHSRTVEYAGLHTNAHINVSPNLADIVLLGIRSEHEKQEWTVREASTDLSTWSLIRDIDGWAFATTGLAQKKKKSSGYY